MAGYPFFRSTRHGRPGLGLLVTRQHAARATERNRIKRCIREAFRLEQDRLGPMDVLVRPPYGTRRLLNDFAFARNLSTLSAP